MKKIILAFSSLFLLTSCGLNSNFFSANLLEEEYFNKIQTPEIEIQKTAIIIRLKKGISFVSFPLLSEENKDILNDNDSIINVWQKNGDQNLDIIDDKHSYFIETSKDIEINWDKAEETIYNSAFLNTENSGNFISLSKGIESINLNEIKINNLLLVENYESLSDIIDNFYVFTKEGEFIDLMIKRPIGKEILLGGGIYIKNKIFSKITWELSSEMQKTKDKQEKEKQRELDIEQRKIESEEERQINATQSLFEKRDIQVSKIIFNEVTDLIDDLLSAMKNNNKEGLDKFSTNSSLLAQIHDNEDVLKHIEAIDMNYWVKRDDWTREFRPIKKAGFDTINTTNRAVIFVEFPLYEEEINIEKGIRSFFRGIAFVRDKDCSWKFDPIETIKIEDFIKSTSHIYTEKNLQDAIENLEISLNEKESFTNKRLNCAPKIDIKIKGGYTELEENKMEEIIIEESVNEEEFLREIEDDTFLDDHNVRCEKFSEQLNNMDMLSLENFVYDDEDEKEIEGPEFPKISFSVNICKKYWSQVLGQKNILEILNSETQEDPLFNFALNDDTLYLFLGTNRRFNCKSIINNEDKRDYCYFGNAIEKNASTDCKKIESDSVKSFCAGHISAIRNDKNQGYIYCERIFGEENDKNSVMLRNCKLNMVVKNVASKDDCKSFKKRFLFFFSKSTPSYEYCMGVVNKSIKTGIKEAFLSEEEMLESIK